MSSGMIISRLGVQATASDDLVHGLLCLRISIPMENESNHAMRWNLFSGNCPKLISEPTIHPLPLPLSLPSSGTPRTSRPRALAIASTLLSLPQPSTYPPTRQSTSPYLHTAPTGQVSVVLDPSRGKRKGQGGKDDCIVILEFEAGVEEGHDRQFNKVLLSLPKCLHSVIRFQITPPSSGPSTSPGGEEVSIITEPKMLALSPSTFPTPPLAFPRNEKLGYEEGWEDGEDLREESSEEDDDDIGSWLEGRFQATNQLRLEWSFLASQPSTLLHIEPRWDTRHPEIELNYETTLDSTGSTLVPIEIIIPEGWAWRSLHIDGPGLRSFRSTDIEGWHTVHDHLEEDEEEAAEDSFSTIRNLRPSSTNASRPMLTTRGSSSLMRQSLPDVRVDEFSFENNDDSLVDNTVGPIRPATPLASSIRSKSQVPNTPTPARLFDLVFQDDPEGEHGRSFSLTGVLVPLPTVLVSGSIAVDIPFVRTPAQGVCQVTCANSTLPRDGLCDTASSTIGRFTWTDMYGASITPRVLQVKGDIRVRLYRDQWATMRMVILFSWPTGSRAGEVVFHVKGCPRIRGASVDGVDIRRCANFDDARTEVRLASDAGGMAEVSLDLGEGEGINLPRFEGAEGRMILELRGTGWDAQPPQIKYMTSSSTREWTTPLPPPSTAIWDDLLASPKHVGNESKRARIPRTLFSFSTFFNILLLWLVISLGQQVQRLRSEISFVAEEAKDLRMYSQNNHHQANVIPDPTPMPVVEEHSILPDGIDLQELLERLRVEQTRTHGSEVQHALGRVVFGQQGWEWANHPAIRSVSHGVSRIWDVVIWLFHG